MKYNFACSLALLLGLSVTLLAQDKSYTITGSVKKYPADAVAYLQYRGLSGEVKDSVAVQAGNFIFSGKIDEPRPASIVLKEPGKKLGSQHIITFYIEPGDIGVSSRLMLSTATFTGSAATLEKKELDKLMANQNFSEPDKVAVKQVVAVPAGSLPPRVMTMGSGRGSRPMGGTVVGTRTITDINELPYEMQSAIRGMREEAKVKVLQFINNHPNSFVSMYTLNRLWEAKRLSYAEYIPLLNSLGQNLIQSNAGKVMFAVK